MCLTPFTGPMRTRLLLLCVTAVIVVAALLAFILRPPTKRAEKPLTYFNAADEKLVRSVQNAVITSPSPDTIEASVGVMASLDTRFPEDQAHWQRMNIDDDITATGQLPPLKDAKTVMYWLRPVEDDYPHIVGVLWYPNGDSELFYGIIRPGRLNLENN